MTLETYSAMFIVVCMRVDCGGEDVGEQTMRGDKHEISHYLVGRC